MNLKPTYCFDDILIEPIHSTIKSRSEIDLSVNLGTNNRNLILKKPLVSSPMDTVTDSKMAIEMAKLGGIGIIHRFMTLEEQINNITNVKRYNNYIYTLPYCIDIEKDNTVEDLITMRNTTGVSTICVRKNNKFYGLITKRDIPESADNSNQVSKYLTPFDEIYKIEINKTKFDNISSNLLENDFFKMMMDAREMMESHKVQKIPIVSEENLLLGLITTRSINYYFKNKETACLDKFGRLCVGAAVGIKDNYLEKVQRLVDIGIDLLCVDVANGHNYYTLEACRTIRERHPNLIIMAGNICSTDFETISLYNKYNIDCLRIGIGNGSICSTRIETGVGNCQFTSLNEVFDFITENKMNINLICDGGSMGKTGNKVKALASGAKAIMLGRTLASTLESPGELVIRNGKQMKYFRGMASTMANISNQEKNNKKNINKSFTAEGVDGLVEVKGNVEQIINQIQGGLKSGLSYLNSVNIEMLHEKRINNKIKFRVCTSIGLNESGIRIKTL